MARNDLIQYRRDTAANWAAVNPLLADGEVGYDRTNRQIRVGDGVKRWDELTPTSKGDKGDTGAKGTTGDPGKDGSNVLPTQEAIIQELTEDGPVKDTLSAKYVESGGVSVSFTSRLSSVVAGATPGSRARLFTGQEPSIYRQGGKFRMLYNLPGAGIMYRDCPDGDDPTVPGNWSAPASAGLAGLSHQSVYLEGDTIYLYGVDVTNENIRVATANVSDWTVWTLQTAPVMTAPIGTQPSSHSGNTYLVKRGEGDYVMFVEANWQGTYEGATIGMWQTWVATGASPTGTFTKVRPGILESVRPLGVGMCGGPSVYREDDQWVMVFHGTSSPGAVIPTEMYRAVNRGELTADTWEVLNNGHPWFRRAHKVEVDQVADGVVVDGPNGTLYEFHSGNQNPNTASSGVFNVIGIRLTPGVVQRGTFRTETPPADAQPPVASRPVLTYTDVPALNPAGTTSLGTWGVVVQPSALGGVVRRNYLPMPADYLAFQLRLSAGRYRFRVLTEHGPDMGILAFRVRPGTLRDVAISSQTANLYAAAQSFNNAHEFDFTIHGDYEGPVWLQMQSATTKDAASIGFRLADQGWQLQRMDVVDPGFAPAARPGVLAPLGDDFNRADTTDVPGPKWTPLNASGGASTTFRIASNKLSMDTGSATTEVCVFVNDVAADARATADFTVGTSTSVGLAFRYVDHQNFAGVRINQVGQALLYKMVGGVTTSIASADAAVTAWPAQIMVVAKGDNAKVYVNGSQVIDSAIGAPTLIAAKKLGLRANAVGATPPTFDNFIASMS